MFKTISAGDCGFCPTKTWQVECLVGLCVQSYAQRSLSIWSFQFGFSFSDMVFNIEQMVEFMHSV